MYADSREKFTLLCNEKGMDECEASIRMLITSTLQDVIIERCSFSAFVYASEKSVHYNLFSCLPWTMGHPNNLDQNRIIIMDTMIVKNLECNNFSI